MCPALVRPSLAEDLATLGAESIARHPARWGVACVLAALGAAWLPPTGAGVALAAVVTLTFGVAWTPRALLRGWPFWTVLLAGGAIAGASASDPPWRSHWSALSGIAGAAVLLWSAATARALRRPAPPGAADEAAARTVARLQASPWLSACACLAALDPLTVLYFATSAAFRGAEFSLREGLGASHVVLAASIAAARGPLRAAAVPAVTVAWAWGVHAIAGALLQRGWTAGDVAAWFGTQVPDVLVIGSLCAVVGPLVALGPHRVRISVAGAAITLAAAAACIPLTRLPAGGFGHPELWAAWGSFARSAIGAVVVLLAVWTGAPARWVFAAALAFAAAAVAAMAIASGRSWASLHTDRDCLRALVPSSIAAVQAGCYALIARRVRAQTLVPADHAVRADFGVAVP